MKTVWLFSCGKNDSYTVLGIYSTHELAQAALESAQDPRHEYIWDNLVLREFELDPRSDPESKWGQPEILNPD